MNLHPFVLSRRAFVRASLGAAAWSVAGAGASAATRRVRLPSTLEEKVGQLFVVSFSGLSPTPAFLSLLQRRALGGVTLFARNCAGAQQVKGLIATLQRAAPFPLLVSVDQEGGSVVRIKGGIHTFPAEAAYGQVGSPARVSADAAITAADLKGIGVTLNLAPVVDVLGNGRSPIGTRSYGSDPRLVSALSVAAIKGYQQHGMACVAKHFIGLGHTSIDSHESLPTVNKTLAQLEADDLIPFRAAIAAGVSAVMVAHVALPAIDPVHRPASLSPVIIKNVLRKGLRFHGVVMTDSLTMGALPAGGGAEAAERAFIAGSDLLLLAENRDIPAAVIEDAVERIVAAVRSGRVSERRLDRSVSRVLALKRRYHMGGLAVIQE